MFGVQLGLPGEKELCNAQHLLNAVRRLGGNADAIYGRDQRGTELGLLRRDTRQGSAGSLDSIGRI